MGTGADGPELETARETARTRSASHAHVAPVSMLPVEVVERHAAAREVICLWLAQPGTLRAPAAYLPGQFTTLALPTPAGEPLYRSYSLSGDGRADRPWEITVKRQHAGLASSFLYDQARQGMMLYASSPRGTFTLPRPIVPGMPLVFVAAGSGIAPIVGMLRALALLPASVRPRTQLHYAASAPEDVIYARELAALDPERRWLSQWQYLASAGVRMEAELVLARTSGRTTAAHWYICGPDALKRMMQAVLVRRGTPPAQIHVEVFGGRSGQPGLFTQPTRQRASYSRSTDSTVPASLWLADTGQTVSVQPGETILEALERNGYHPPFSCRAGVCGECRLRVLAGEVRTATQQGLTREERAAGCVLACVARPAGVVTLASASGARSSAAARTVAASTGRSSTSGAVLVLRVGAAAAAIGLFGAALGLTHATPSGQQSSAAPSFGVPAPAPGPAGGGTRAGGAGTNGANGTNGASGIVINPGHSAPNITSGAS